MARALASSQHTLEDQTRILQLILDSMGDGVVVADERGALLVFNPAAERILGKGAAATAPADWTREYGFFRPDQATPFPAAESPLARALHGEPVDSAEIFVRNEQVPEGCWINVSGRPLVDAAGVPHGGVAVFRDTTEHKRIEETIRNLNAQLEQRVRERTAELAEVNRDLTHKNRENETFVYTVSHDLRSPLVNLQGFSKELSLVCEDLRSLLSDANLSEGVRPRIHTLLDGDMAESIRYIQNAVLRLSNIIDALLRLSRAGRVEYMFQQVDLAAVVAHIVAALEATIAERGATVTIQPLPPVRGDPTALEQVFANLVGNALKYLHPDRPGVIVIGHHGPVTLGNAETYLVYQVRDNGVGIPEAYHHKIFQAFQRFHPEVAGGEGMGLAIVRRIVDRHHGKVWVESEVGKGSTFHVALPAPRP